MYCNHSDIRKYVGLTESYDYCHDCGKKQNEIDFEKFIDVEDDKIECVCAHYNWVCICNKVDDYFELASPYKPS